MAPTASQTSSKCYEAWKMQGFVRCLRACLAGLRLLKNGFGSDSSGGVASLVELEPF
jgi:hypothetical protein